MVQVIITQNEQILPRASYLVQANNIEEAGEISLIKSCKQSKAIKVGIKKSFQVGIEEWLDGEHEEEEKLSAVCQRIIAYSFSNNVGCVAFDVDSFSQKMKGVSYCLNVFIDVIMEMAESFNTKVDHTFLLWIGKRPDPKGLRALEEYLADEKNFVPITSRSLDYIAGSFGDYDDQIKPDFEKFIIDIDTKKEDKGEPKTFAECLFALIDSKQIAKDSQVYFAAGISKATFSKIRSSDSIPYKPSKGTVAALAIGLKLSFQEAQQLYHIAGYHLGTTDITDLVIRFHIDRKIYDIQKVNFCLMYYKVPLLGAQSREESTERNKKKSRRKSRKIEICIK